jgi:hypothetical protein
MSAEFKIKGSGIICLFLSQFLDGLMLPKRAKLSVFFILIYIKYSSEFLS